jgi:hypothetical protein
MQRTPESSRLGPNPGWRQRRNLRSTAKYQQIRAFLGTSDSDTLLLMRLGDLQSAEAGQAVTHRPWSRSHIVIGLTARLAVGSYTEITAPWLVDDRGDGVELTVSRPGLVLFVDRRHWHLIESAVAGKVEPVAPIAKAATRRAPARRVPRPEWPRKASVTTAGR